MDADFFQRSMLDVLVPDDGIADLSALLASEGDHVEHFQSSPRLLDIKERDLLFFDERLRALAVLQLPHCEEEKLKSYLTRLSCKIDVWAVDDSASADTATGGSASTLPSKDLVFSCEGFQSEEPTVLASQSPDGNQSLALVWEVEICLNRPRFRLTQPAIVIVPSASVASGRSDEYSPQRDLAPFQPLEPNILEPMRFMQGFQSNPPYLAASRLERVIPVPATHKHKVHIAHVSPRPKKAVPPTIARIRYQRASNVAPLPTNIACLDIEIIPFVQIDGFIKEVALKLKNGRAESLMPEFLPMPCQSGDSLTFIYKLHQALDPVYAPAIVMSNPNIDILAIKIQLEINLSKKTKPIVHMEWTTHVDFSQALNPSFGPPSQPIQRLNRPMSLSVANTNGSKSITPPVITSLQPASDSLAQDGVSISFTASSEPVYVGKPFVWKVLVVNHGHRASKLTIIPLPRIPRHTTSANIFAKRHAPKSSTASFHRSERWHNRDSEEVDIAQAVVDENVIYAMHHSNVVPQETDLMALTAELRIGPLGSGQSHESELEMIAFEPGALRVDAIRIVDLVKEIEEGSTAPGVVTDIRDLPDVIVVQPPGNES